MFNQTSDTMDFMFNFDLPPKYFLKQDKER